MPKQTELWTMAELDSAGFFDRPREAIERLKAEAQSLEAVIDKADEAGRFAELEYKELLELEAEIRQLDAQDRPATAARYQMDEGFANPPTWRKS